MAAAYSATNDRFALAWSGIGFDGGWVAVSWYDANGSLLGLVEAPPGRAVGHFYTHVSTASVEGADLFLVQSFEFPFAQGHLWAYSASTPGQLRGHLLNSPLNGGDLAGSVGTIAVFVGGFEPHATLVECATGQPVIGRSQRLGSGNGPAARIASTGGRGQRYLAAWQQGAGLTGAVFDADLNILDAGSILPQLGGSFDLDGDGETWLLAWTAGTAPNTDVWAIPLVWNPATGTADVAGPAYAVADDPAAAETVGAVAFTNGSFLVSYEKGSRHWLVVLDPITGAVCEEAEVPNLLALSGQTQGDRALLGWEETSNSYATQVFRTDDGVTVDLGGGCGAGGEVLAYCAVQGNAEFALRLRNAAGGVAALAVIGLETPGLECGPCTFFPNPAASVSVPAGLTSQAGTASVTAPIPNVPSVVGASVVEQWLTLGGGGCLGGVSLSNGLRVQLQ